MHYDKIKATEGGIGVPLIDHMLFNNQEQIIEYISANKLPLIGIEPGTVVRMEDLEEVWQYFHEANQQWLSYHTKPTAHEKKFSKTRIAYRLKAEVSKGEEKEEDTIKKLYYEHSLLSAGLGTHEDDFVSGYKLGVSHFKQQPATNGRGETVSEDLMSTASAYMMQAELQYDGETDYINGFIRGHNAKYPLNPDSQTLITDLQAKLKDNNGEIESLAVALSQIRGHANYEHSTLAKTIYDLATNALNNLKKGE